AVRGDDGVIVVDVGDGDGDGLAVGVGAVRHLHGDVVDVVAAGIGGVFRIRIGSTARRAGRGIAAEFCRIGAADDAVAQRRSGIGLGGGDGGRGWAVLGVRDRGGRAAAVGGDDGGVVVDVGNGDGDGLAVGVGAVRCLHGDVVDVVAAGIGGIFRI